MAVTWLLTELSYGGRSSRCILPYSILLFHDRVLSSIFRRSMVSKGSYWEIVMYCWRWHSMQLMEKCWSRFLRIVFVWDHCDSDNFLSMPPTDMRRVSLDKWALISPEQLHAKRKVLASATSYTHLNEWENESKKVDSNLENAPRNPFEDCSSDICSQKNTIGTHEMRTASIDQNSSSINRWRRFHSFPSMYCNKIHCSIKMIASNRWNL